MGVSKLRQATQSRYFVRDYHYYHRAGDGSPKRNKDDDPWVLKGAGTEGSTPHAAFFAKSNVNASGPENSSTTSLPSHADATMGPSNGSGKGLLEEPVHAAAQKLDCVST